MSALCEYLLTYMKGGITDIRQQPDTKITSNPKHGRSYIMKYRERDEKSANGRF
jgi:hypothetical protein